MQKIAIATEDNEKITSHFGRAPYYRVVTLSEQGVSAEELRSKTFHGSGQPGEHAEHGEHQPEQGHNHHQLHADMFAPIQDCQVLLVGGMGEPAYEKARSTGLQVVLTGGKIDDAVQAYLRGELVSDERRIHRH